MLSSQIEEYLESIFKLQVTDGGLRPTQLSEDLGVSVAAVTDMMRKLRGQGLVEQDASSGIRLTAKGESEAKLVVRKHRLTERFLTDVLGMPWDSVHEQACKLEHAMNPEVVDRLEIFLDNPNTCPHGHPVPASDGSIVEAQSAPLSKLKPGSSAKIMSVAENDPQMLQYLASLGLMPGVLIKVIEVAPFNGPILISIEPGRNEAKSGTRRRSCQYALGQEVAAKIAVGVK